MRINKQLSLEMIIVFLCIYSNVYAAEQTTFFNQAWLKSVVSIEKQVNGSSGPIGTGFLISTENNHTLLVTAKHVVLNEENNVQSALAYRINLINGQSILLTDEELKKAGGGDWFLSDTSDIALRFMAVIKGADVATIAQDMFLQKENIQAGTPAFILGFPMGLRSEKYATALVRQALVSSTTEKFL